MFYIIDTDNNIIDTYDTYEDAQIELMFYNDEYAIVEEDYFL